MVRGGCVFTRPRWQGNCLCPQIHQVCQDGDGEDNYHNADDELDDDGCGMTFTCPFFHSVLFHLDVKLALFFLL